MTNEEAAKILAKMHMASVKKGAAVNRKRALKPSERAMWLSDLQRERLAICVSYKALTGRDLVKVGIEASFPTA